MAQERHGASDIFGLAPVFEGGALCDAAIMRQILSSGFIDAGFDVTWGHCVDPDTFRCSGQRQRLSQHHDAALAGAISGDAWQRQRRVRMSKP
jgi:hypothetical protein